jgi:Predicted SAM-dependent methyltransferases
MRMAETSLAVIREYLNEMMYSLIDFRLSFHVEMSSMGFPTFSSLRRSVDLLDPAHRVLFQLFRIGEAVDNAAIRQALPDGVFTALVETELLVSDEAGRWRTPSLLIVPVEGLYLLVGIPPLYPTATRPCNTGFDTSSSIVAKALPVSLTGQTVLDICSGSGVQALICAARGADSVVGLELNEEAVTTARANASLNGLDGKVDFRQSDKLMSLREGERFDFVVCNTPSSPMVDQVGESSGPEAIGNVVLLDLLSKLPDHLSLHSSGILCAWRSLGYQSRTYQLQAIAARLATEGFSTAAYVDKAPNTIESMLRGLQTELERRPEMQRPDAAAIVKRVRGQLAQSETPIDGLYNQLIYFRKAKAEPSADIFPLFATAPSAHGQATASASG